MPVAVWTRASFALCFKLLLMTLLPASVVASLFVWCLPFDLSSNGGPASSYATAGIALRVTGVHIPLHHDKVETPPRRCMFSIMCIYLTMGNWQYTAVVFDSINCNALEITTISKYCGYTIRNRQSWVGGVGGIVCCALSWNISPITLSLCSGN
jgi:hypothetical protein